MSHRQQRRQHLRVAADVRAGQRQQVQGVQAVAPRRHEAEGVQDDDLLPHFAAAATRHLKKLALDVHDDDRAGIGQEVRNENAPALARAGRRTGDEVRVPVVGHGPGVAVGRARSRRNAEGFRRDAGFPAQQEPRFLPVPVGACREHARENGFDSIWFLLD